MLNWIKKHFSTLQELQTNAEVSNKMGTKLGIEQGFQQYIQYAQAVQKQKGKFIFIGNGGSAGIASHLSIDHSKNGQIPSMAFNDASALTCLGNDYGYENIFAKQLEYHARPGDVLIAISSSGRSKNILNGVEQARREGYPVVTFSGFTPNNPLRELGDLNFYVDSRSYGFVEVAHMALIHAMLDYITEAETHFELQNLTSAVA